MSERFPQLAAELAAAKAQPGEFVVFGSAVMLLHGLRERAGDVDLFVRRSLWRRLYARGWRFELPRDGDPGLLTWDGGELPAAAFYAWTERDEWVCADACFRYAEDVDGLPCAPLWLIRVHKAGARHYIEGEQRAYPGHAKHLADLAALDARLAA